MPPHAVSKLSGLPDLIGLIGEEISSGERQLHAVRDELEEWSDVDEVFHKQFPDEGWKESGDRSSADPLKLLVIAGDEYHEGVADVDVACSLLIAPGNFKQLGLPAW